MIKVTNAVSGIVLFFVEMRRIDLCTVLLGSYQFKFFKIEKLKKKYF